MRSKSELQKALHASTRNRQLKIPPMPAKRLKPMVVCACDNPNSWGCPGTMQGIVMGAVQMQMQGLHNCTNLYNGDNTTIHRHGLLDGLQASSYGARKFLAPRPTEKASSRLSSKIVWKSDPTGLAASLLQNSRVLRHQKTCKGDSPNSSSNIALGVAYLTPQMCLRYLS